MLDRLPHLGCHRAERRAERRGMRWQSEEIPVLFLEEKEKGGGGGRNPTQLFLKRAALQIGKISRSQIGEKRDWSRTGIQHL